MIRSHQHNKGYTLIELLIATGLGIMMLSGVMQVFTSNSQTIRVVDASARVQESGRIALDMMARDVRIADYWGCANTVDILNHLDTSGADTDYDPATDNPTNAAGLAGQDNISTSVTIGGINVTTGTDTITFRGASQLNGVKVESPYMTVNSAALHINTGANLPKGTKILITDCEGGDYFSNTANNTSASGTINHNTGNLPTPGHVNNSIKNMSHTYSSNAVISTPYTTTYFIGPGSTGGTSLYRYYPETTILPDEIIPNVTDLQLQYGYDTNNSNSANRFQNAAAANLDATIAVRITITIESPNGNIVNGNPLSREYSTTATIRNRLL